MIPILQGVRGALVACLVVIFYVAMISIVPMESSLWLSDEELPRNEKDNLPKQQVSTPLGFPSPTLSSDKPQVSLDSVAPPPSTTSRLPQVEVTPVILNLRQRHPGRLMPHGILAGIRKCGSTTLFDLLTQHPQILPGTKERNYFGFHVIDTQAYVESFPKCSESNCTGKITVDGTVACTSVDTTPFEIRDRLPDAKLMFLFRNPTERAFSAFKMDLRGHPNELVTHNFTKYVEDGLKAIKIILENYQNNMNLNQTLLQFANWRSGPWKTYKHLGHGLYYYIMKPYLDMFSRENILLLKTRQMNEDPETVARMAYRFLGVSDVDGTVNFERRQNEAPSSSPSSSSPMDPYAVALLDEFYAPYNDMFNELAKEDMELGLKTPAPTLGARKRRVSRSFAPTNTDFLM